MQSEITAISNWLDDANSHRTVVELMLIRVGKVCEESGEVWRAVSGLLGENPRKGVTHTRHELMGELFDTAVAALCAVEHLRGNDGQTLSLFVSHVVITAARAGL